MADASIQVVVRPEFYRSVLELSKLSTRTLEEIGVRKSYFITRRTIWYTHKADFASMAAQLGQTVRTTVSRRTGKTVLTSVRGRKALPQFNSASSAPAPLLALIINKRRGEKGLPGLYGTAMKQEFRKIFSARSSSIGYIKSGWIESRDAFKRWCMAHGVSIGKAPPNDPSAKQIGPTKKGGYSIETPLFGILIKFWNSAATRHDHKQALFKYGLPALDRAFAEETADTIREIDRRISEHAEKFNRMQHAA